MLCVGLFFPCPVLSGGGAEPRKAESAQALVGEARHALAAGELQRRSRTGAT